MKRVKYSLTFDLVSSVKKVDKDIWVAECDLFNLTGQGKTAKLAVGDLKQTSALFLASLLVNQNNDFKNSYA